MKYTLSNTKLKKEGEKDGRKWYIYTGDFNDGKTTVQADYFGKLDEGEVEGTIETDQYGKKFKQAKKGGGRTAQMNRAMDKKAENIATAQRNREEGIKISSCNRMATDVIVAQMAHRKFTKEEVQKEHNYWKTWFYTRWDDVDSKDVTPFD